MAYSTGRGSFAGTGSQTIVTNLAGTPTGARITISDSGSSNISVGTMDGTHQNVVATNYAGSNARVLFLKNGAGATLGDVAWSSFTNNGTNGEVVFSVTTQPSASYTLEVWN